MPNVLSRSYLAWSFRQLGLCHAVELTSRRSIPWVHTVRVPLSTLGKRRLATSTIQIRKKGLHPSFVCTLRPERLSIVGQDVIDLSGKTTYTAPDRSIQCAYEYSTSPDTKYIPFPMNTKGFFYYHDAPNRSEFYTGVRFRICHSVAEFENGRDLLDPRGDVWGYKILEIVKHRGQRGFLSLLRAENLIDEELINYIKSLDITNNVRRYQYSLSDPFYVNIAQSKRIAYITRAKVVHLTFPRRAFTVWAGVYAEYPMTGLIKAQFEISNLPEHERLGPTLVMRVLDVLKPIAVKPPYDEISIPVPVPGSLLHRLNHGKKRILGIPLKRQRMADDLLELMKTSWV